MQNAVCSNKMKHFTRAAIDELEKRTRANLINSVTGFKPANLVATIAADGLTNLAIFTSVVHLGANPPLLGMILRPPGDIPRHTYENIRATGVYTINHVGEAFVEAAHRTSAKFPRGVSEFEKCGLTEEFVEDFAAPFVKESAVKIGLKFVQEIPIEMNGTILIIGEIVQLMVPEAAILEDGSVALETLGGVCVSALDTYYRTEKIAKFPYARADGVCTARGRSRFARS